MSRDGVARSRGHRGASAWSTSPLRHAPLRKVLESRYVPLRADEPNGPTYEVEVLECGHEQRPKSDLIGRTYAERRRCRQCGEEACAETGHRSELEEHGCKCGASAPAFRHLWGRHRIRPEELAGLTLEELAVRHDDEHYRNGVGVYIGPDGHTHAELERGHVDWKVAPRGRQTGEGLFG